MEWIESQKNRLFNIAHFHVVFTLPHDYLTLWRYNEALFTQLLFKASQQTLLELLGDKKYHGVTPGILMALHTWGRQLTLHPHTHCLITAGGLTPAGTWQDTGDFLLPIPVVKAYYRGKFQALIRDAYERGDLQLPSDMAEPDFWQLHQHCYRKEWSVRIEERYEHGKGVMLYLARYLKGGPINPKQIEHCTSNDIRCVEEASISASGIAFPVPEQVTPDSMLVLDLLLRPSSNHVNAMGRVISCEALSSADSELGYYLRVEFIDMNDKDRETLIQHIVQRQGALLRALRDEME